jgi:hypothetical protein
MIDDQQHNSGVTRELINEGLLMLGFSDCRSLVLTIDSMLTSNVVNCTFLVCLFTIYGCNALNQASHKCFTSRYRAKTTVQYS